MNRSCSAQAKTRVACPCLFYRLTPLKSSILRENKEFRRFSNFRIFREKSCPAIFSLDLFEYQENPNY